MVPRRAAQRLQQRPGPARRRRSRRAGRADLRLPGHRHRAHLHLRAAARRDRGVRRRAHRARRRPRGPRRDLHADGARGRDRDARVRPHRRRPRSTAIPRMPSCGSSPAAASSTAAPVNTRTMSWPTPAWSGVGSYRCAGCRTSSRSIMFGQHWCDTQRAASPGAGQPAPRSARALAAPGCNCTGSVSVAVDSWIAAAAGCTVSSSALRS